MLGLADRSRVLDLFEKVMGGAIAEALAGLGELYDRGADPLAVMQDLLEIVHFLTRVKVAPDAEGFFDGSSREAKRAASMAGKLSMASLTRAWSLLLKGLFEVRDAARPVAACEMALIRLSYAVDLPPTDRLVRDLLEGDAQAPPRSSPPPTAGGGTRTHSVRVGEGAAQSLASPAAAPAPTLRSLEDIAALAGAKSQLRIQIENNIHLVSLEPGRLEFRPGPRAPRTLAADLAQKLKEWTGARWVVTLASEGGAPTLAEQQRAAKAARHERVLQEPLVRAVMDRFPGAEIVAVRDIVPEEVAAPTPEDNEE
jgi:DNA polymerase-3 subunit gamma/tau